MNTPNPPDVKVTVMGEALIDLVPGREPHSFQAHAGGSPYNVAIGLARLGHDTTLMARLGDNAFGRLLRERAEAEGVHLDATARASEPATLAVVSLDARAQASYDFYLEGTADWHWTADEIGRVPEATGILHFGSLASWMSPGDSHVLDVARRMRGRGDVLVSYDPNIRPGLLRDRQRGRWKTERAIRLAHLAKASAEDVGWLYPDRSVTDVAQHWIALGATVVVITDSANGADAFTRQGVCIHRPARHVAVADTVGAGDSFTAGLLGSLVRRGTYTPTALARCPEVRLSAALDDAILVASLTCQRPGPEPPTRADVEPARSRRACPSARFRRSS